MIDHVSVGVRDLARATRFYEAVLGVIGYIKHDVRPATVGFGKRYPEFLDQPAPASGGVIRHRSTRLPAGEGNKRRRRVSRDGCGGRRNIRWGARSAAAAWRRLLRGVRARSRRQSDRSGELSEC